MIISNLLNLLYTAGTPFTATVSGDWNASATWGNAGSPAVKGVDYPGNALDVATINAGVVVKYNVVETNELGDVTVNGTLWFPLNATTKMTFGHTNLTVGATGKVITSSDGTIGNIGNVDKAYTLSLVWNTTADNTKGLVITNGAYIDIRGDDQLYGGTHGTTLATNWTAGKTLTAVGTAPLSWVAGQTITVARNTGIGVATTLRYTIASVLANGSNTDITISETAPAITFVAGGQIENEARNVKIYKFGAETPAMATVYTNRPWIDDNHVTGTVKWKDVQITGFYQYDGASLVTGGTFTFDNCIFRNGYYGFYRINIATLSGCNVYSNGSNGFHTFTTCTLTSCNAYSNNYGFYSFTTCTLTSCNAYSTNYGFHTFTTCTLTSCNAYSSTNYGFHTFTTCTLTSCNAYSSTNYGFYSFTTCTLTSCNAYSNNYGFHTFTTCTLTSCNAYANTNYGFYFFTTCTLTSCNAYSNTNHGFHTFTSCTLTSCNAYSNTNYGFYFFATCTLTSCNAYSNTSGFYFFATCTLTSCNAYSNTSGFYLCDLIMINGTIGWNGAVSAPNTYDFRYPNNISLINVKVPQAGFVFYSRNADKYNGRTLHHEYNQVANSWRVYECFGTITKTTSPAGFKSANSLLVEPLSLASITNPIPIYSWINFGVPLYLPAQSVKVSLWVLGQNWVVFPLNTELWIELDYLAGADGTRTTIKSTQVLSANNVVTEFSVTVVPTIAGIAYLRAYMCKYETDSTHKVYLDGVVGINSGVSDIFDYTDSGFMPIWNGRNVPIGGIMR